jgi:hypothetical protein
MAEQEKIGISNYLITLIEEEQVTEEQRGAEKCVQKSSAVPAEL